MESDQIRIETPLADLVARFEQTHTTVMTTIETCPEEAWDILCPSEGRSVGVVAHHIAMGYTAEQEAIEAMIAGRALPAIYQSEETLNAWNADHAAQQAQCGKAETLDVLHRNAQSVRYFIASLTPQDLQQGAPIPLAGNEVWSVYRWIDELVINHPLWHLESIHAALGT
jgi:hypothetical protein